MKSIWDYAMPAFRSLTQDLHTDVLIIGGGITGLLCAHRLAKAGIDYALVEAKTICSGVTENTTAKLTAQHGLIYHRVLKKYGEVKARQYWEANRAALESYRKLCGSIDCGYEEKDAYVYALDNRRELDDELRALERLGIPAEFCEELPLPFPLAGAIRFPRQAQFHPLRFLAGIAEGLQIYENTKVLELLPNRAVTERGVIRAEKIIVATHFPFLNKHGSYFLKLYQDRSYVLALENAADVNGMYIDATPHGLSFRNYKDLLLLGGGGHRTGKHGGGWDELSAFAAKYYPRAKEVARWATQDCMTLDGIPYVGRYSKRTPDLLVATGYNKWGMTGAMAAATMLTELVQDRDIPEVFSPSRSILHPQLVKNGVGAVVNLLTPTVPRCPHMGCALKWNAQEHTWDCPCHGSRFEEDGRLINNPATDDKRL